MLNRGSKIIVALILAGISFTTQAGDSASPDSNTEAQPLDWPLSLEVPGAGGWELVAISEDDDLLTFMTKHLAIREGNTVSVWVRSEYRTPQGSVVVYGVKYLSAVRRFQFDCEKSTTKVISETVYSLNNLEGTSKSFGDDSDKVVWLPVTPGTVAEVWLNWACVNIRTLGQSSKSK